MNRKLVIFLFIQSSWISSIGQHQEQNAFEGRVIFDEERMQQDSLCNVLHRLGTFEGHLRTFFMSTLNHQNYPDYYALGVGGGLGYYSPIIKNFQVGMSGFIIYNTTSSHLGPRGSFGNRYELALFDITNPDNHEDLDRLENLYLRYYFTSHYKSFIQAGKFHINTPLINLQDSRMRPNLQEGLWMELNDWKKIKFKAGWLWRISPRSTIHWYGMGESVGIYPTGRAVNGKKAAYAGNVKSEGILVGNLNIKPVHNTDYQLWNYYVDNLFNLSLHKLEWKKKANHNTWLAGFQYLWQKSLYNGTLDVEKQYISKNEQSHVLSGRLGFTNNRKGDEWSVNYTRITRHGRFLFPREWGTETLYTYNNRERNEGAGDVHSVMLEHIHFLDKGHRLSLRTLAGIYQMPSVDNARLNKYSMPSYYHLNAQARYKFNRFFHGLQTFVLYTYKDKLSSDIEEEPVYYHNKIDMHHLSVVMDYYF